MRVLGLMTGASPDAARMAVLETDGRAIHAFGPAGRASNLEGAEGFLGVHGLCWADIDVIGLDGPGDAALLAKQAGVPVAHDFHAKDMAEGGRGAPLAPVYHRARASASELERPLAVFDTGAASVTHIAQNGLLTAFGVGPGMIEDLGQGLAGREPVRSLVVCGPGRRDPQLMATLKASIGPPVLTAEEVGWRGDAIEAEACAYLAARAWNGYPISFRGTTGIPYAMTGGRIARP
jgi:1,6-anhydro-N-acetylmuramate kinase